MLLEGFASAISQGKKCYFSLSKKWLLDIILVIRTRFNGIFIFPKINIFLAKHLKEINIR